MASELKPCPFCQYKAHEWIQGNKKMACCDNMDCPCRAIVCTVEQWNTRPAPAATDTGLVTVAWESMDNKLDPNDKLVYEVKFPRNGDKRLVYKSQAEELLAAERAENTRLQSENDAQADQISELQMTPWPEWATKVLAVIRKRSGYDGYGDAIEGVDLPAELDECIAAIEADNAALTARVNFLERTWKKAERRADALEAKLAAAEKALEPFADHANDRAVDDTGWRDKETVKIVVSIGDLRKARAVLGGKPS